MDTVGTFEMAIALGKYKILTAVHKHYTVDEWKSFAAANESVLPYVAVSSGISEDDFTKLATILADIKQVRMICLDVANG
jgi:GMP reductase